MPNSSQVRESLLEVPRCSVHPDRRADYWCTECHCYVSSHCHVRGPHRDHAFITLREAAENHVEGMRAWMERCASHIRVAEGIVDFLDSAQSSLTQAAQQEETRLNASFDTLIKMLGDRKQQLQRELRAQVASETRRAAQSADQIQDLINFYRAYEEHSRELLRASPPLDAVDDEAALWSADLLRTAELLYSARQKDTIPLPHLHLPMVTTDTTPNSFMQLLYLDRKQLTSVTSGASLPEVLSIEPFFLEKGPLHQQQHSRISSSYAEPHHHACAPRSSAYPPSGSLYETPQPLTLDVSPEAAAANQLVLRNGVTLTRVPDSPQRHVLTCTSQTFHSGLVAWDVCVDRIQDDHNTTGHVLAGIIRQGSEGEGVVWDGEYIVGPHEQECRVLPASFRIRSGTTLSFAIDLRELQGSVLHCYVDHQPVASVRLPPARQGWTPSVSVLSADDQVTILGRSPADAEWLLSLLSNLLQEPNASSAAP